MIVVNDRFDMFLDSVGKNFIEYFCINTFFFFLNRVSLYSPGCPETYSVDQAGLELRNLPASASQVLGIKACATMPSGVCEERVQLPPQDGTQDGCQVL